MKIQIRTPERGFNIVIPSVIALNHITALIMPSVMKKNGTDIPLKASVGMVKEINRYRRNNPDWYLIEVESSGGACVKIKL